MKVTTCLRPYDYFLFFFFNATATAEIYTLSLHDALPIPRYLLNTVLYAAGSTTFMLLSSVPAAYALSQLRWRGRNFIFIVIICMMMMPPQVTTVPIYLMWANWHLAGTLWPLVLPALFG